MYQLTNEEKGEKLNFAAGILIVEGAGGIVTNFHNNLLIFSKPVPFSVQIRHYTI